MITLGELFVGVQHRIIKPYPSDKSLYAKEIRGVCSVSAECKEGEVFVCIVGRRSDGHAYASEAISRGAAAVVCERGRGEELMRLYKRESDGDTGSCIIEVEGARSVFAKLCARFYRVDGEKPRLICVTGTNGKTTVSTMIARGLNSCGRKAALLGTLGGCFAGKSYSTGSMTTPDSHRLCEILAAFKADGAEYIVMEASSHALALDKLDGLKIHMGVFTNLTAEHLDFHGDMEGYFEAKARLFERCEEAVIFADDPYAKKIGSFMKSGRRAAYCSLSETDAEYFADEISLFGENGVSYCVICNDSGSGEEKIKTNVVCRMAGEFSVINSLLAFAVLSELGLKKSDAAEAIRIQEGVKGRIEKLGVPKELGFSVFVDFAHTPDALSKLLCTVRGFLRDGQRVITLFGCGGDRDRSKRSLMGAIASRLSDFVIITSDNSRTEQPGDIIAEILTGVDKSRPHAVIEDRRTAIEYAIENAGKGDVILLCGKGHEEYETDQNGTRPFSERKIVWEAVQRRCQG